jgi:hypothetical protein
VDGSTKSRARHKVHGIEDPVPKIVCNATTNMHSVTYGDNVMLYSNTVIVGKSTRPGKIALGDWP